MGAEKVEKFLAKRLEGSVKSGLEAAIKKIKRGTTPAQFFDEVATSMGLGLWMNGLDKWFEAKFAATACDHLVKAGLKITSEENRKEIIDIITDIIKDKSKEAVKKAIETTIERAKGDETQEELGSDAAREFAKSNMTDLEEQIIKRLQKR